MIQRRIHTRQDDIKQWSIYLSQYFNVALTVAEVKSLLGFRLPVLESKSLEAIQHDRKPSVFTINAMDAPTSPADFIPFWNYSFSGTKLYVIYDVTEATRRHLLSDQENGQRTCKFHNTEKDGRRMNVPADGNA